MLVVVPTLNKMETIARYLTNQDESAAVIQWHGGKVLNPDQLICIQKTTTSRIYIIGSTKIVETGVTVPELDAVFNFGTTYG